MTETDPDALDTEAAILQARAASIRITAELVPLYVERLTASVTAELAAREAEAACAEPGAEVKRLTAELSEVNDRAALAAKAVSSPELSARLDARVRLAACGEEAEHLSEALRGARAQAHAAQAAAARARREAERAAGLAAEAAEALKAPLTSTMGQQTGAYASWLVHSGLWMLEPRSALSRALIEQMLGPSGVGARVQRDAVRAYLAGDPAALDMGGTDHLPDGSTVTHAPGRPPLVSRPRLSAHQAAAAMQPAPQAPGPAEVAAGLALDAGRL